MDTKGRIGYRLDLFVSIEGSNYNGVGYKMSCLEEAMQIIRVLCFSLLASIFGCAIEPMPDDFVEEEVTLLEWVYKAPGFSAEEIYDGTKVWIAENFRSAKAVLEFDSKEKGLLIGNGQIEIPCIDAECSVWNSKKVRFTMRVDIKDDRFKLMFSNFVVQYPYSSGSSSFETPIRYEREKQMIEEKIFSFGESIVSSLNFNNDQEGW